MIMNTILIGMAASGKSTIGRLLAKRIDWAFVDTDQLIEAWWGAPLHQIADTLGKEAFLRAEAEQICQLGLKRCIIATGGSVVYSEQAMDHLGKLGRIIYLKCSLESITERLTNPTTRGLAIAPGQSIRDLYEERIHLYERYAHLTISTDGMSAPEITALIISQSEMDQEFI